MLHPIPKPFILLALLALAISCGKSVDGLESGKLFTTVPEDITGVHFQNKILESEQLHYYKYLYIYIGGGVAAADFNNDGLEDLFFTSNIYPNKLYLNKGDFKFEDITERAGITKRTGFDAGVAVADVNNDGFLDIYVNRAGWYTGDERLANMLYINNGDLTFTEQAAKYGLDDTGRSISSTFFDYDKDGDLDLFITNAPADFNLSGALLDLDKIQEQKQKIAASRSSDKLYRNNGKGFFEDVSEQAGILADVGFGLHAQVGDLNNDGWLDVYVSNDFIMPDFAYINNGDGTFTDKKETLFKHISYYSMGGDFADVNNDGLSDLMVADMSPEDYKRSKTTMSMMSIDRFNAMTQNGYHHQYMHNVLQLNNGENMAFSEIANLSGISKTDWSWATLFADFDLDGYNDLYVTNGVYRDVVDRDANTLINDYIKENRNNLKEADFLGFTQKLPQQKLVNYLYRNEGNLTFTNKTQEWSNLKETFSNGAVYVDLDNDGDLDIVTSNLDENATILKNNSIEQKKGNYLQVRFKGPENNRFGVGAKVILHTSNGSVLTRQLINGRGYLSSMSNKLHFGLSTQDKIDKLEVIWPDDKKEIIQNITVNQVLELDYANAAAKTSLEEESIETLFTEQAFDFGHEEKIFNDFDVQLLLPHKLSQLGPAVAKVDLNGDGVEDLYLGGAQGFSPDLLVSINGAYQKITVPDFEKDKLHEDVDAIFFDADNDGDLDLYVVSGSYEFNEDSPLLQDRLYINKGNLKFERSKASLPDFRVSGSVAIAGDYDSDGDLDLFIGGRVIPGQYPYSPKSTLLMNNGGTFQDVTQSIAEELSQVGMVTTAQWADMEGDGDIDLVVAGEWMGIEVFTNTDGKFIKDPKYESLGSQTGWWNKIMVTDMDADGDMDIIAGNLGLNYKFHASKEKPFHVYTNDFDENGTADIMLAKNYEGKLVPVRGKNCTSQQMPYLKERVKTYEEFASRDLKGIVGDGFETATHLQAVEFRSGYFVNGQEGFEFVPFTTQAQMSPVNGIIYDDFDGDGIKDLVLAGNNYMAEVETTRADAGIGNFLKGTEKGTFQYVENRFTGFYANKDARDLILVGGNGSKSILVANNNGAYQFYKMTN